MQTYLLPNTSTFDKGNLRQNHKHFGYINKETMFLNIIWTTHDTHLFTFAEKKLMLLYYLLSYIVMLFQFEINETTDMSDVLL